MNRNYPVRRFLLRLITTIQLTRLSMAFGAAADLLFIVLLSRAMWPEADLPVVQYSLPMALLAAAGVAIGLFAYGAALNDILDVKHDSAFSPERPLPAGRIRRGQAVIVAVAALMTAILSAELFGTISLWITLFAAAAVLFYNAAGKYIPSVGIITIGLVHAANMFIPNHELAFTIPVWLIMTHVVVIAVLVHTLEDKRPRLNRRAVTAILAGWVFWSLLIIGLGLRSERDLWPEQLHPLSTIYPVLAVMGFAAVMFWKTRRATNRMAAEKLKRYGAMWQCLYGAAWLYALNMTGPAVALTILAFFGFLGMTLIRELTGLTGRPLTYRG